MSRKCPNCGSTFDRGSTIILLLGLKRRCRQCDSKLQNSQIWMFVLTIVVVFATIASLGFINLFGVQGFVLVGLVPVTLFLIGSYFVPLNRIE